MSVKKIFWGVLCLALIALLAACANVTPPHSSSTGSLASDSLSHNLQRPSPNPTAISIPSIPTLIQTAVPTPTPRIIPTKASTPVSSCVTFSTDTTRVPLKNGGLAAPYGSAPVSTEAQQITQQLFQQVNRDRAACGLPPFTWNATLASGALLHSWNMYHCGFSHYCPDGMTPYQRIANEGFASYLDCGENIGLAGPYPTPWGGVYSVQESMAQEPLGGWHRIHLFSTTLHQMGIGIYVAPNGWLWFTEDMSS